MRGREYPEVQYLLRRAHVYCSRPETWNLDRAKAPRIADHKSPYIVNILRLKIDDPRGSGAVQIQVHDRVGYRGNYKAPMRPAIIPVTKWTKETPIKL